MGARTVQSEDSGRRGGGDAKGAGARATSGNEGGDVDMRSPEAVAAHVEAQVRARAEAAGEDVDDTPFSEPPRRPSARQQAREARQAAEEKAMSQTVRDVYRKLASALHPDREPDETERVRKTALMSEANTAYARKDLVTLMQIQLRAELADPTAVSRLADDRLAALTLLLKQQVAGLERERAARQGQLAAEFELPHAQVANPNTLRQALLAQVAGLEAQLAQLEQDLAAAQDAAALKRWLNRQREAPRPVRADRDPDDYF